VNNPQAILEMRGVFKYFPGARALNGVDFRLFPGEVHSLMGENGAGKSTLIKALTGVYKIDKGEVFLEQQQLRVNSPLEAQAAGINTVYQEVNLCTNLSVAENIFIGQQATRFGAIRWKELNIKARELLARLDVDIDVTLPLHTYSIAIQQLVAIARALHMSSKILILDEPTSSLDSNEVAQLFRIMRQLKSEGIAILFVSHFLDQVYEISDRITVLRNGELIGEYMASNLSRIELISKMIGKDLDALEEINAEHREAAIKADIFLKASGVGRKGAVEPCDLEIRKGEVLGLAGLLGSGRTELARLIFGADRADQGQLQIGQQNESLTSPRQAINRGIAFCSENRKQEGIIGDLSVRENIIVAFQATRGWLRMLPVKRQVEIADEYIRLLGINPANPEQLVRNLSGGNQQKVLLARWLLMNPQLLILDEPTRGIDVGAKAEIQKLVATLSNKGMSFLFISSEIEEVLRVSHRIAVLRDRRIVKELVNRDIGQHTIMQAIAEEG